MLKWLFPSRFVPSEATGLEPATPGSTAAYSAKAVRRIPLAPRYLVKPVGQ